MSESLGPLAVVAPIGVETLPVVGSQPLRLASRATTQGLIVKAKSTNTAPVEISTDPAFAAGTGYELVASEGVSLPLTNTNLLYVRGTQSDILCVIAL